MRGYAGVIAFLDDSVLLVQEGDFFIGELRWSFPSGRIEAGESRQSLLRGSYRMG